MVIRCCLYVILAGYPPSILSGFPNNFLLPFILLGVERHCEGEVSCHQEHDTLLLTTAQTWTPQLSTVQCTKHKGPFTQAIFVAATQCNSMQFLSRRSCNQLRFHCDFSAICQFKRQYPAIASTKAVCLLKGENTAQSQRVS